MSQDANEVYARLLLPKRHGYPLWIPEPNRQLPAEYREKGVMIGDVGIVTADGAFDFLFNICLPADHPINSDGVPEGFKPLQLGPRDIFLVEDMYDPGSHIASTAIKKAQLIIEGATSDNPLVPAGFGGGFRFTCSTSEGAILVLPNGGSRENLTNLTKFRQYALQQATNWYRYANGPLGREACNGSIYLVTGCDKVKSWGVASFSNILDEREFSLSFTAACTGEGTLSCSYAWETISPAAVRTGPKRIDEPCPQNQCVFIRGFKLTLRDGAWAKLLGPVQASLLTDSKAKDLLKRNPVAPFTSLGGLASTYFGWSKGNVSSEGSLNERSDTAKYSGDGASDHDVEIPHVPQAITPSHPSQVINQYLLGFAPDTHIAITHDDDWCSLISGKDEYMPKDEELLRRFRRMYGCGLEYGGVFPVLHRFSTQEITPLTAESTISASSLVRTSLGTTHDHRNISINSDSRSCKQTLGPSSDVGPDTRTNPFVGSSMALTAAASVATSQSAPLATQKSGKNDPSSGPSLPDTRSWSSLVAGTSVAAIGAALLAASRSTALSAKSTEQSVPVSESSQRISPLSDVSASAQRRDVGRPQGSPSQVPKGSSMASSASSPTSSTTGNVLPKPTNYTTGNTSALLGTPSASVGLPTTWNANAPYVKLCWTNQDPRESLLFGNQGLLYRFQTTARPQTVTDMWRFVRANKQERVARLEWAPNGGLGRALIGKIALPMLDLCRPDPRIYGARSFFGPDGRAYSWQPKESDLILLDQDNSVLAFFRNINPIRYQIGDVYGELSLNQNAGTGTVLHPPMMDTIVVSCLLCRFCLMYNL